jgi:hypothetical protein
MRTRIVIMVIAMFSCLSMAFGACADDPMSKKEAKPNLKERFTKETIKGTLMEEMDGDYYWIKDDDGKEIKIHVDQNQNG